MFEQQQNCFIEATWVKQVNNVSKLLCSDINRIKGEDLACKIQMYIKAPWYQSLCFFKKNLILLLYAFFFILVFVSYLIWLIWFFTSQSTIFQLCHDRSSLVEPVLSKD